MRDFLADDLHIFPFRDMDRQTWGKSDIGAIADINAKHPGRTMFAEGEVLACYGVIMPWPTMGILWAFVNPVAWRHRFQLWRTWRQEWQTLLTHYGELQRIEAMTLAADAIASRVPRHLGFSLRGLKRHYGPCDADFIEWEWLREKEKEGTHGRT